jgi:hypothetical protein
MAKGNGKLYDTFAKAFHEVVVPELDQIKEDVKETNTRLGRVEEKLVKIDDSLDRHAATLDNHEKRIGRPGLQ